MTLPSTKQQGGTTSVAMTGAVERSTVIYVLELALAGSHDTSFQAVGNTITLVKDGKPEVVDLPDPVSRKMLQRLSNKYDVKIEYFFHPGMLCRTSGASH